MDEYTVTVARRDPDHPLLPQTLLEFGVPISDPRALAAAVENLAGLLKHCVTPEKAVEFMKHNAALAKLKTLVTS